MAQAYPKISIVTPSYNQGKFIDRAIKSVIDQGYPDFEHIIVDNCSTDGTLDILKRYPHLSWVSEPDKGQSDALNKGIRKATGELIGWLNADDLYLPNCFRSVARFFQERLKPDVIYGDYRWVNEKGRLIKLCREVDFDPFVLKYLHVTYIPSTATFFKRAIFKEGNFLDSSYELANDFELFLRLMLNGYRFTHLRSFLADYRWHPESKSKLYAKKQIREREKVLFLHDRVMQKIPRFFQPGIRALFMVAARLKRTLLKFINLFYK